MAELTWVGRESTDTITLVRQRCYGSAPADRDSFLARSQRDRFDAGDVLLAREGGEPVGTATHLSLSLCVDGTALPCQGVAWVGTTRSHRRRRSSAGSRGIASQIMAALLDRARERGDVCSALMPFRSSFYEHFGYGNVEQQAVWTVPLSLLPDGDTAGFAEATDADVPAMVACRTRQAAAGQCDVDDGQRGIDFWRREWASMGFTFVDRQPGGAVNGFVTVQDLLEGDRMIASVEEPAYDSLPALRRVLAFLGSLRDQYSAARFHLPIDLPLAAWLKESQLPHRRVDHAVAACRLISRMQVRVIDPRRWLEAKRWRPDVQGKLTLGIAEPEGAVGTLQIDVSDGRAAVKPSIASPQVTVTAAQFAAISSGATSARVLAEMGLIERGDPAAVGLLDGLHGGRAPFCWEYF